MASVPTSQIAVSITSITEIVPEATKGFDIPVELHLLDNANKTVEARIKQVSPALFELTCEESLKLGQRLALSHEGRRIEVAVSSSLEIGGHCRLVVKVVADQHGEVRSELRLPTDLPTVVTVAGESEQIAAKVVDMSPSGMGVRNGKTYFARGEGLYKSGTRLGLWRNSFCQQKPNGLYFAGFLLEEYIGKE